MNEACLSGKHVPKWEKKHGKLVHGSGGGYLVSMYQNGRKNMANWYMLVLGIFSKHVPKWTKKNRGNWYMLALKGEILRRESKKRREKKKEKKITTPPE